MELIEYKGNTYPKFQAEGFAAKFAFPYAQQVCKGMGFDVGCNREEWKFPGAVGIDPLVTPEWDALNFPPYFKNQLDYIFSSHCLEHLQNWVDVLDYWTSFLKKGGILFLYLPDYSQVYWRPWNNKKHLNIFTPQIIADYMEDRGYKNIFKSGVDLNNAFMIFGEK